MESPLSSNGSKPAAHITSKQGPDHSSLVGATGPALRSQLPDLANAPKISIEDYKAWFTSTTPIPTDPANTSPDQIINDKLEHAIRRAVATLHLIEANAIGNGPRIPTAELKIRAIVATGCALGSVAEVAKIFEVSPVTVSIAASKFKQSVGMPTNQRLFGALEMPLDLQVATVRDLPRRPLAYWVKRYISQVPFAQLKPGNGQGNGRSSYGRSASKLGQLSQTYASTPVKSFDSKILQSWFSKNPIVDTTGKTPQEKLERAVRNSVATLILINRMELPAGTTLSGEDFRQRVLLATVCASGSLKQGAVYLGFDESFIERNIAPVLAQFQIESVDNLTTADGFSKELTDAFKFVTFHRIEDWRSSLKSLL